VSTGISRHSKGEDSQVLADLLRIIAEEESSIWSPASPQVIASHLFCTYFMGMAKTNSKDTQSRAKELSKAIILI
jgi:hypothetical protein